MSHCAAVTHCIVPKKEGVASLQHPVYDPVEIIDFFVTCCKSATPIGASAMDHPLTCKSLQLLRAFEPLWTPWSLWASLIAFEPQWTSLKALKAFDAFEPYWNDRTHRNLIRDSLGFYVWVFPTLPLIALQYHCVLGNRTSMIDSTARGSPIVIVFT